MSFMLGLTPSELGIVLFIFLLVVAAAKLPAWGEKIGAYLYRRREPTGRATASESPASSGAGKSRPPPDLRS
jgi:Sec-independent protein translocase protein TatA